MAIIVVDYLSIRIERRSSIVNDDSNKIRCATTYNSIRP